MNLWYGTILSVLLVLRCTYPCYARNSLYNVRASQCDDDSKMVDIYYDITADDPWECDIYYSLDGGINYEHNISGFSGNLGRDIEPGEDRHITWDVCSSLPEIDTECHVRVMVTFWVGYKSIPEGINKSIPMNRPDLLKEQNIEPTEEGENKENLVDYFQKRCCHKLIVQSESPPFRLLTADEPEIPPEPDPSKEPEEPGESKIINSYDGIAHCPTLNEWGMITFMVLLVCISILKLKKKRSHI
ncbi:MAG: hypothetical protein JXB48_13610 [Candidatus Latescibacteria bacterium]|nr:hypothetical protein [Candidatus Latescibacterota bacterium]